MIQINLKQLKKLPLDKINVDNVRIYDNLIKNKGKIVTLDERPYIDFCCENNIFYTQK